MEHPGSSRSKIKIPLIKKGEQSGFSSVKSKEFAEEKSEFSPHEDTTKVRRAKEKENNTKSKPVY